MKTINGNKHEADLVDALHALTGKQVEVTTLDGTKMSGLLTFLHVSKCPGRGMLLGDLHLFRVTPTGRKSHRNLSHRVIKSARTI